MRVVYFSQFKRKKMQKQIKVAVIGGTGKAGKYLVKHLLERGFFIKLLLRSPEAFNIVSPLIEIVKGDARDAASVRNLVEGVQIVISTLGQPKGEPSIFSPATKNVIRAMAACNVSRYIVTTGLNVDVPGDNKNERVKMATEWMRSHYPETTADRQLEYAELAGSGIDWTLVRVPLIELTDLTVNIRVCLDDCPGDGISATSLAEFLVTLVTDGTYGRKALFISNE
jgi:putative NADH-flavin reductase